MKPDYDRQTNPRWPNHIDDPTQRARAIARMYRAHLRAAHPDLAEQADTTAAGFGETWMLERQPVIEPHQELTATEAAALVNVAPKTIHNWAYLDHPENPHQKLLPKFKKRGRERTYLAQDVLAAKAALLRARHADTPR